MTPNDIAFLNPPLFVTLSGSDVISAELIEQVQQACDLAE
jgi:hypothetical protein